MLEFLRKHTLIVMGAMVLVFFGLVFIENSTSSLLSSGGNALVKVGNTSYSYKDYVKIADSGMRVASRLSELYPVVGVMTSFSPKQINPEYAFLVNYAVLKEEAERFGIYPSNQEIDKVIQNMPEFTTKKDESAQPQFDQAKYNEFISMRGKDAATEVATVLREMVATKIRFDRLQSILSRGLSMNDSFTRDYVQSLIQDITVQTAVLSRDTFRPKTEPGDEVLKPFWEKQKMNYLSDERRSMTVYTFTPTAKIVETAGTKIPAATLETLDVVEKLWEQMNDANGKNISEVIEQAKKEQSKLMTITQTDLKDITKKDAEAQLTGKMNAAAGARYSSLAEAAFDLDDNYGPVPNVPANNAGTPEAPAVVTTPKTPQEGITAERISDVLVLEDGKIVLICVSKIIPAGPLDYAAARSAARADYILAEASNKMKEAGNNLREKLAKTKSAEEFESVAKAQGAQVAKWGPYNPNANAEILKDMPNCIEVFKACRQVNVGQITSPINTTDSLTIARVDKKTITDSPENKAMEANIIQQIESQSPFMLLQDWFMDCYARYQVSMPSAQK